jgi:hypothetical protein
MGPGIKDAIAGDSLKFVINGITKSSTILEMDHLR